jgi:hypothetical protein
MRAKEILECGPRSDLLRDPHARKVWDLVMSGENLFKMGSAALSSLRSDLIRSSLAFFERSSDHYADLFDRLDIKPSAATVHDVARLAIPSDMLRGEGQRPLLIREVEQGGETFQSSGTTGKDPVRIYRSPLDLAIMLKANTDLFEHLYGDVLRDGEGIALFMAAPELRHKLSFVAFVHLTLENKGIELLYGMDLENKDQAGTPWQKLTPNRDNLMRFLKSKKEPKLFFTAPAGVHLLGKRFDDMGTFKRAISRMAVGAPPLRLGKGGMVVTGGGSKGFVDLPPYGQIVEDARRNFQAKGREGKDIPVPFMDVLGMTETLTALIDREGAMDKVPHPLSEVFLMDPANFDVVERPGIDGILGIFNPFVTSWLECFYPGDIMSAKPSQGFYGREFVYRRRLTVQEGWEMQRACGGTLEEMMVNGGGT